MNSKPRGIGRAADEYAPESRAIVTQSGQLFGEFRIFVRFYLAIEGIVGLSHRPRMQPIGKQRATSLTVTLEIGSIRGPAIKPILRPGAGTSRLLDMPANPAELANQCRFVLRSRLARLTPAVKFPILDAI